jgi:predicted RNase H-like nuclease (RuvC/YqgF family)
LIVGLDPGTNVGIAILDVRGRVLSIFSKRGMKRGDIINYILDFGRPLIIASDVTPAPRSVEKIASSFGSKLYYPEFPLMNTKKFSVVREHADEFYDLHQRDALVAALKAWKKYRSMLNRVDETLASMDRQEIFEDVVKKLLVDDVGIMNAVNDICGGFVKSEKKV